MKTPLLLALVAATALSGCGFSQSRLNPFNWFGGGAEAPATLEPETGWTTDPDDLRTTAAPLTDVQLKRVHGGVVVTATGVPPTQGWWDAELKEAAGGPVEGVLTLRFVLAQPLPGTPAAARTGRPESRAVTAARFVSIYDLRDLDAIVVEGAGGSRTLRP